MSDKNYIRPEERKLPCYHTTYGQMVNGGYRHFICNLSKGHEEDHGDETTTWSQKMEGKFPGGV